MRTPNEENEVLQRQRNAPLVAPSSLYEYLLNFLECKKCLLISTGLLSRPAFKKCIRRVIEDPGDTSFLDSKN